MPASALPATRVVIVTLDNHLKGAVERASARLADENIEIVLHAASDWDRVPGSLEQTESDIAQADIVIATMLFLDDHVRAPLGRRVEERHLVPGCMREIISNK